MRIHKSLRVTPAMAAGVSTKLWEISDIVALIPEEERRSVALTRSKTIRFSPIPLCWTRPTRFLLDCYIEHGDLSYKPIVQIKSKLI